MLPLQAQRPLGSDAQHALKAGLARHASVATVMKAEMGIPGAQWPARLEGIGELRVQ